MSNEENNHHEELEQLRAQNEILSERLAAVQRNADGAGENLAALKTGYAQLEQERTTYRDQVRELSKLLQLRMCLGIRFQEAIHGAKRLRFYPSTLSWWIERGGYADVEVQYLLSDKCRQFVGPLLLTRVNLSGFRIFDHETQEIICEILETETDLEEIRAMQQQHVPADALDLQVDQIVEVAGGCVLPLAITDGDGDEERLSRVILCSDLSGGIWDRLPAFLELLMVDDQAEEIARSRYYHETESLGDGSVVVGRTRLEPREIGFDVMDKDLVRSTRQILCSELTELELDALEVLGHLVPGVGVKAYGPEYDRFGVFVEGRWLGRGDTPAAAIYAAARPALDAVDILRGIAELDRAASMIRYTGLTEPIDGDELKAYAGERGGARTPPSDEQIDEVLEELGRNTRREQLEETRGALEERLSDTETAFPPTLSGRQVRIDDETSSAEDFERAKQDLIDRASNPTPKHPPICGDRERETWDRLVAGDDDTSSDGGDDDAGDE